MIRAALLALLLALPVGVPPLVNLPSNVQFAPATGASSIRTATATWYCNPPRYPRCTKGYGPSFPGVALTPDMGIRKGTRVEVCRGSRCTFALVIDCNCAARNAVDLYASVWRRLGVPLSRGRMTVTVSAVGVGISVAPPTDTAP
jgi:hypothetical protein